MAKRGRKPAKAEQTMSMQMLQEQILTTVSQEILFVYGSLMEGGRFHGTISRLQPLGNQAYLPFTRKTMQKHGGFPSPVPDVTSITAGEAYLLPTDADEYAAIMAHLDRIESVSSGLYARTQLPIIIRDNQADNQQIGLDFVLAWVYVAQETTPEPEQIYDFAPLFAKFKEPK
jgi:gamma-glutamylcyclotransferase (GGCT)/AIG2-like uncharacterized protein YtfP